MDYQIGGFKRLYRSPKGLSIVVLGKIADVRPYTGIPGYATFVDRPGWALPDNLAWIDSKVEAGHPFLLVSDPLRPSGIYRIEIERLRKASIVFLPTPSGWVSKRRKVL